MTRDEEVDRPLPSWVAWDEQALKQQAAGLVELQASLHSSPYTATLHG